MTVPPPGLLLGGWTLSVAPSTAAGVTLAAVCCAAFGLWRVPPPGGRRRRATVAALRLVAVAAVAVLICGPERRVEGDAEPVPFPVLLDVSDSMRTGGNRGAGGEPSRGEDAVAVIRRWGKGRPLHIRPFAATLGPPAPVGTAGMVDLDRTGSDPAAAVRAALTDPAVRRAGLLAIMTDGRSTVGPAGRLSAAAGAARQAGVRLLIVGAGEPDPLGGPRLVTFTAGRPIGAGEPVTVAAAWTFVDGAPLRPPPLVATVVDRSDGTVAAAGPVTIGDDGVARFAAVVTPPAAGRRIYDLTLSAHDAPIAGAGGSAAIDVPGETVRVLLTADRPRHEVRFLQSLLEREPTVRLTAAVGADQRGGGGEPEDADRFDVTVTVGPAGVGPAGVGLAGDGSNPDSASGRINVTASPVEGAATEPAAVVATAGGRGLGLFLTDPPAIYGRLADLPPDPADVPLATAGGIPLVTLRRGAGGAILTVRTAQTWRWREANGDVPDRGLLEGGVPEGGVPDGGDVHRRFWLAAIRLAAAPANTLPALRVEPTEIEAGGVATVFAEGTTATAVRVEGDNRSRVLPLGADRSAAIRDLPPGRYRLVPHGGNGADGDGAAAELTVTAPPGESGNRSLDRADLRLAAERSGGRFVPLADAADLDEFLPPPPTRPAAASVQRPAESAWPALLIAALLGAEWLLRRRGGGV